MAYSAEVIRRARERLAKAREDRESENRQHLAQAYEKCPRIRQIDLQLRRTMAQAAQAAFRKGSDGRAEMDAIRQENLALQQERAQLVGQYFEEGYLDDSPICTVCGGSGYVGSNMCECLRELCRQEQKKELTFLSAGKDRFEQFSLDYYPDRLDPVMKVNVRALMERNLQMCRRYAATFSEKSPNLLFSGDTGLGKTFLSACIARVVADRGYSVVYESASHLFGKLEQAKFYNDEQARQDSQRYTDCDLLIVDDLGTEMPSQFTTSALYTLINDRILYGRPMILSTNLNTEDFSRRYSSQVASRLNGNFQRVPFLGEDIRAKKNWGM